MRKSALECNTHILLYLKMKKKTLKKLHKSSVTIHTIKLPFTVLSLILIYTKNMLFHFSFEQVQNSKKNYNIKITPKARTNLQK